MKKRSLATLVAFALLGMMVMTAVPTVEAQEQNDNIVQIAQENGNFDTLVTAVQAAGLTDTLSSGCFTVFAPTDEAFAQVNQDFLNDLVTNDTETLGQILTYHVVPGQWFSSQLTDGMTLQTVQGETLLVTVNETGVFVNDAKVTQPDIVASNGVIHVIDSVLLPSLSCAQTIFALPELSTLFTAVQAAGLEEALSGDGTLTVFAPTNDAFAQLDQQMLNNLLTCDQAALAQILSFHVVGDEILSEEITGNVAVTTLQGEQLQISLCNGAVLVDGAQVTVADIICTNGVIHVIDQVLIPPSMATAQTT